MSETTTTEETAMSDTITLDLPGTGMFQAQEAAVTTEAPKAKAAGPSATAAQTKFIRGLLAQREGSEAAEAIRNVLNDLREQGALTVKAASDAITMLKAIDRTDSQKATATAAPAKRTNRYAQKCDHCGRWVDEGEGLLDKSDDGKWVVTHDGECPSDFPFPEGHYAVVTEEGGDLGFYHATEGEVFVQASDEYYRLKGETATKVVAAIEADPAAASLAYGKEIGRCGVCHRTLTNKASRDLGIGPVCAKKMDW